MCLAQGPQHIDAIRLEPAAPRSQVKHSTTEPLNSHKAVYLKLVEILLIDFTTDILLLNQNICCGYSNEQSH